MTRIMSCFGAAALAATLVMGGCRNTAHGVKEDTKTAVQKTGEGMQKAGNKLENAGKK